MVAGTLQPRAMKLGRWSESFSIPTGGPAEKLRLVIPILLVMIVGAFYVATIRAGHDWGDDFAMYIQEAIDIAHHVSYAHSNYIFNPRNPILGPPTYPPVYPLLLSPVYMLFGINLTAMKVENILFFVSFLLAFYLFVKDSLRLSYLVGAIAIIGFNPYFWELKDSVISEAAYVCLLYFCFLAVQHDYGEGVHRFRFGSAIYIGALLYLCYGTRTIGILLIPALFVYEILRNRQIPKFSIAVGVIFLIAWALQHQISSSESNYLDTVATSKSGIRTTLDNTIDYAKELSYFWDNGYERDLRIVPLICFSGLALFGYFVKVRKGELTVAETYAPLYLALIIVWPLRGGSRFIIPLFPLYIYYGCVGMQALGASRFQPLERYVSIILLLVIGLTYAGAYSKKTLGPIHEGIEKKETVEFFHYVREKTDPRAVFIFAKPRALGLFGERKTSIYPISGGDAQVWDYISSVSGTYLVRGPMDDPFWYAFIDRNRNRLLETYSNHDFTVYKALSSPLLH